MSRSELSTALRHQSGPGHRNAALAVSALLGPMRKTLVQGGRLKIPGEVDRFSISAVSIQTE